MKTHAAMHYDSLRCCGWLMVLPLVRLLALRLGLLLLPQLLLVVIQKLLVLLGPATRLVTVTARQSGRVVRRLGFFLLGFLLDLFDARGVGDVVGEGPLVFRVEAVVRVFGGAFEGLAFVVRVAWERAQRAERVKGARGTK